MNFTFQALLLTNTSANPDWEFFKIIISVLTGFIPAFLGEPVKIYFTNKSKKKNLRKALYREIVLIYDNLFQALVAVEEKGIEINLSKVVNGDFDCYKYAKSEMALFYQMDEASLINKFYSNVHLLNQEDGDRSNMDKHIMLAKLIILQMESLIINQQFDRELLLAVSGGLGCKNRLRNIIRGKLNAGEVTGTLKSKKA